MKGVTLRCRTCGTTQDHEGECEACRDGIVAYYCGNHVPGLWLDTSVCGACGARYGEAVPTAPRRPPPSTERPPTSAPGRVTATPPTYSSAPRGSVRPRRPTPAPHEPPIVDDDPAASSLAELLVDMAEDARRRGAEGSRRPIPPIEASRRGVPWLGCALRFVLLVLFLVVAALFAAFVLVGGLFVR